MSEDSSMKNQNPLENLDQWEEFLTQRYPDPAQEENKPFTATDPGKKASQFRDYKAEARNSVKDFYRVNHAGQTLDFVLKKKEEFKPGNKRSMGIWKATDVLNTLVDDSDPDTDLPQIEHLLQTSEAIRAAGHPDWFVLTGFIHDLGKVLCLFGEPQWAVVGDTFPVGCAFSDKIVFHEFFELNPDNRDPRYLTRFGIYSEGIGLGNVHLSWGHDEYLYQVVKDYLPEEALYIIRYHSFYAAHREKEYTYLMNDKDKAMFRWVRAFNPFDLYSKSKERPNVDKLMPYYQALVSKYFPEELQW
ncbi:MAG TPA: inositol oxygenase family protein [Acidobacteriota bacterium]